MKKYTFIVFLVLILAASLPGCGGTEATSTAAAEPEATAADPVTVLLSFPDGAPPLNQSRVLKCAVINNTAADKIVSVDIDAPKTAFVLESGSLSWNGTVPANSETTAIEVTVKSFHTGHWEVDANYHIDAGSDGYGGDFATTIYVNLGPTSSEWGTTPPWQKK